MAAIEFGALGGETHETLELRELVSPNLLASPPLRCASESKQSPESRSQEPGSRQYTQRTSQPLSRADRKLFPNVTSGAEVGPADGASVRAGWDSGQRTETDARPVHACEFCAAQVGKPVLRTILWSILHVHAVPCLQGQKAPDLQRMVAQSPLMFREQLLDACEAKQSGALHVFAREKPFKEAAQVALGPLADRRIKANLLAPDDGARQPAARDALENVLGAGALQA